MKLRTLFLAAIAMASSAFAQNIVHYTTTNDNVKYVFAGHYHRNAYGKAPGIEITTTGPVSKPLGVDPSGIRVARVGDKSIESTYYGLGNIPNALASDGTLKPQ